MIDLDPSSPVPLYRQIADGVRELIATQALRPGDRIPAVRDLAARVRVNRNTAARAIRELEGEGIVRTRVGQGTFVEDGAPEADRVRREAALDGSIDRLVVEARALGIDPQDLPERVQRRIRGLGGEESR